MSFIGNPLVSQAFVTDSFSGNGSTTAFTMSVAPATTAAVLVAISGVVQDPSTYSIVGTTLTFSQAPPSATANISTRYLGIPSTGVTSTAYRTVTEFTATAVQTTFTPPSFTPGFVNVYRNGVLLGSADYVASSGTTVVLNAAATLGDLITVESFLVSSILNVTSSVNQVLTTPTISSPTISSPTISSPIISGNVGIGTSSPSEKLTVSGAISATSNAINFNQAKISVDYNSGNGRIATWASGGSDLLFYTTPSGGNVTENMRLTGNAMLGMGITPANFVYQSIQFPGEVVFGCNLYQTSMAKNLYYSAGWKYIAAGSAGAIFTIDAGQFNWTTTGSATGSAGGAASTTQPMTLDPSGNLNLGQTNQIANGKFSVNFTGGSGSSRGISLYSNSTAGTAMLCCTNSNGIVGEIITTGSSTAYNTSSDYRLKNTIAPMTGALDKVAQLKPVTYKWNIDGSASQGFIAHELQTVVPECVTGEKDEIDADGNPKYQGIDTSFLVATLTAAIQELSAEVTALKAKVGA